MRLLNDASDRTVGSVAAGVGAKRTSQHLGGGVVATTLFVMGNFRRHLLCQRQIGGGYGLEELGELVD